MGILFYIGAYLAFGVLATVLACVYVKSTPDGYIGWVLAVGLWPLMVISIVSEDVMEWRRARRDSGEFSRKR